MGKYYKPIIKEGDHLVRSKNNPGRYRGQSRDENNKNPDIVEWEEVEIDESAKTEYAENEAETTLESFGELVNTLLEITGDVAIYLKEHPEITDAIKATGKMITKSVSNGIKNATQNAKNHFKEKKQAAKIPFFIQKKNRINKIDKGTDIIGSVTSEEQGVNSEKEEMSIDEARDLIIDSLISYFNVKRNFERLSRASINGVNMPELDMNQVLALLNTIVDNYPNLIDEKMSVSIQDILNTNSNFLENQKILMALKMKDNKYVL